ncbi:carbohydrate-binding protein [Motilimonas cestriensis]|uniref:carbohydrate-binding protein n=1 Tax=Motilimonas cestriensis TaxID=2742685 RepID=UPI003DA5AB0F
MKLKFLSKLIITALATTSAVQLYAQQAPYQYSAYKTTQAPVLDGKLDDSVWQSIAASEIFVNHNDNSVAEQQTWAKLAYDEQYLYVAFNSQDHDIAATLGQQDDPTYEYDDTLEIFLDPTGQGKNYYEIGISALTYYDSVINSPEPWQDDVPWDIEGLEYGIQVNGTLNDNTDVDQGMTVELKIPLASLNYSGQDEGSNPSQWRFNFHRADYSTNSPQWEANAWLAWSPMGSFGFHQPTKFAYLNFKHDELWQAGTAYTQNDQVSYLGSLYQALYYSSQAPGKSRQDGWRINSAEPQAWQANLVYLTGDVVSYKDQLWQAQWWSQSQQPQQAQDWLAVPAQSVPVE